MRTILAALAFAAISSAALANPVDHVQGVLDDAAETRATETYETTRDYSGSQEANDTDFDEQGPSAAYRYPFYNGSD